MFASTNKKIMKKATTKTPEKGYKRYNIYKVDNGILRYSGSFDTKKSENVRIWLAENGYKGRYNCFPCKYLAASKTSD